MIKIKKIAEKYNLKILNEKYLNTELNIEQFVRTHSIKNVEGKHLGLVSNYENFNFDSFSNLEKVDLIVICNVEEFSKDEKSKLNLYDKPIIYTSFKEREITAVLENYLLRKQSIPKRIHASMLSICGEGVIILGKSGIGKSELALALINRSHLFVGDDAIDVVAFAGKLIGRAPKVSRDFIEVRGIGIINLRDMFGIQCILKEHPINLAIEIVVLGDVSSTVDRLGKEYSQKNINGVNIPLIQIPVSPGREITSVVEAAVISFKQRKYNKYIAINDFNKRILES